MENRLFVISLVIYMVDIFWNEFHNMMIVRSDGDRQTVSNPV